MVGHDNVDDPTTLPRNDLSYPYAHSLITVERTEKLELLIHLISHLSQPIVVCGPKGIGKTTLLDALREHQPAVWRYCALSGSPDLDLEALQIYHANQQAQKVVLAIDNAGALAPCLITSIIQYAAAQAGLSVIFVLTADELYIKTRTDILVDECYFIEIPPLSEKQCGDFLQYLATKTKMRWTLDGISDAVIAAMYRETHGIPGKIITALPALDSPPKKDRAFALLVAAVIVLVGLTLGIQWLSHTNITLNAGLDNFFNTTPLTLK
jgi:DamX protein